MFGFHGEHPGKVGPNAGQQQRRRRVNPQNTAQPPSAAIASSQQIFQPPMMPQQPQQNQFNMQNRQPNYQNSFRPNQQNGPSSMRQPSFVPQMNTGNGQQMNMGNNNRLPNPPMQQYGNNVQTLTQPMNIQDRISEWAQKRKQNTPQNQLQDQQQQQYQQPSHPQQQGSYDIEPYYSDGRSPTYNPGDTIVKPFDQRQLLQPQQQPSQQPVQQPIHQPVQQPVQPPVQQSVQQPSQQPTHPQQRQTSTMASDLKKRTDQLNKPSEIQSLQYDLQQLSMQNRKMQEQLDQMKTTMRAHSDQLAQDRRELIENGSINPFDSTSLEERLSGVINAMQKKVKSTLSDIYNQSLWCYGVCLHNCQVHVASNIDSPVVGEYKKRETILLCYPMEKTKTDIWMRTRQIDSEGNFILGWVCIMSYDSNVNDFVPNVGHFSLEPISVE